MRKDKSEMARTTCPNDLIQLLKDEVWVFRGIAAFVLRNRRECSVPEALIEVMRSDDSLCVRREALKSFDIVTSFKSSDIFSFKQAEKWYEKNQEQERQSLKCKDEGQ